MASTGCHYDIDTMCMWPCMHIKCDPYMVCLWCDEIIVRFLQLVHVHFFASHSLLHVYF